MEVSGEGKNLRGISESEAGPRSLHWSEQIGLLIYSTRQNGGLPSPNTLRTKVQEQYGGTMESVQIFWEILA
ncbi:unnamed protein product [Allacma fusca]|uniref:Uncharacterized protein n=1 Tax=Allacma fusca TaxID=39272 RepID=A0A8J2KED1_9HEXA|nr:unnamed protein product [Allacma fusca]